MNKEYNLEKVRESSTSRCVVGYRNVFSGEFDDSSSRDM